MINQIEKIYADIELVRGASDKVVNGLKYNYYCYLNVIDIKKTQLEKKLNELKKSRASSYDEIKSGVERKVTEIKLLVQKINNLFK